ncbi:MAG: xanthine dehydrogenase family protein [Myxococcales bacterium]|nr:xanthine dehydrogenase family protein [Myxococcales bacterium]
MNGERRSAGARAAPAESWERVAGAARCAADLSLPGMLHARILRAGCPHARVRSIDVRRAEGVPGVVCVLTADRVRVGRLGLHADQPVLKGTRVRCVADELAAVAATTEAAAEEACARIRVDLEPLPAVFDAQEALRPGAPRVHEHAPDNLVPLRIQFRCGDPERVLEQSAFVARGTFRTRAAAAAGPVPAAALASVDGRGRIALWTDAEAPFVLRSQLARALGLPGGDVRVLAPPLGETHGERLDLLPFEVLAVLLAQQTGRPVRLRLTPEERLACLPVRPATVVRLATACDREGRLTARVCEVILDAGAYSSWGVTTPQAMLAAVSSLYRVEHVAFRATSVFSNNPVAGALRGGGLLEATFAVEQQMDELARLAGFDPVEFRIRNANDPQSVTPPGYRIGSCGLRECLDSAATRIGWLEPKAPGEGVGIAAAIHPGGGRRLMRSDGSGAFVRLDEFGQLTVTTGTRDTGSGVHTTLAGLAAGVLGLPPDRVTVLPGDTHLAPWDAGAHGGRSTYAAGHAVLAACRELRRRLLPWAVRQLGGSEAQIEFRDGRVRRTDDPRRFVTLEGLVRGVYLHAPAETFVAAAFHEPSGQAPDDKQRGTVSAAWSFAAHAVRVRVDPETGRVRVLKVAAVHDIGRVLHPAAATAAVEAGVERGVGLALAEDLHLEAGRPVDPTWRGCGVPGPADTPAEVEVDWIETADPEGPLGAKALGDAPLVPPAAALANALADATGVRLRELPLAPERVLAVIRAGDREESPSR